MLVIRLFRVGKKNQPFFKIVVIDKRRAAKRGRFVEEVGFLNPLTKEKSLKKERIEYWMSVGAQPSDTLLNLLIKEGIVKGKKIKKNNGIILNNKYFCFIILHLLYMGLLFYLLFIMASLLVATIGLL